jgi:hypothetical protein
MKQVPFGISGNKTFPTLQLLNYYAENKHVVALYFLACQLVHLHTLGVKHLLSLYRRSLLADFPEISCIHVILMCPALAGCSSCLPPIIFLKRFIDPR